MDSFPDYLFALALACLVLWQLVSGKALDRSLRPSITRKDNPGMYWSVVLIQSAFLTAILVIGKTSWHTP